MNNAIGKLTAEWAQGSRLPLWYEPETASTNLIAKSEVLAAENPISLLVTDFQTEGRGRGDHTWENPAGACLLSSWVFQMKRAPQPVISPAVGLAVFRAFQSTWPSLPWSLKAPNDLYLGDQKMAGLLLETVSTQDLHRLVIGLGANILGKPNLPTATCLCEKITLTDLDWHAFLDRLLLELSLAVSTTTDRLSDNQVTALLYALNLYPGLQENYTNLLPDGSLVTSAKTIHWSQL